MQMLPLTFAIHDILPQSMNNKINLILFQRELKVKLSALSKEICVLILEELFEFRIKQDSLLHKCVKKVLTPDMVLTD